MKLSLQREILLCGLTVCFLLQSCRAATPVIRTPTGAQPALTATLAPTEEHKASPTPLTPTSTFEPTMTYVPELPFEEAEKKAISILQNNNGCRLPCFLGITPGKTKEQEAISFLNAYQKTSPEEIPGLLFKRGKSIIKTRITIVNKDQSDIIQWMNIELKAYQPYPTFEEPEFDNPYYAKYMQYYSLSSLLAEYGPPEKIEAGFIDGQMGGHKQFVIVIDYFHSRWFAAISIDAQEKVNGDYTWCPNQGLTYLAVWEPGNKEAEKEFSDDRTEDDHSLEKITKMDTAEFYEQFKTPTDKCLTAHPEDLIWEGDTSVAPATK